MMILATLATLVILWLVVTWFDCRAHNRKGGV